MPTKYISAPDTAKIIRRILKESFPGIKFSVRSKVYSGGASINVNWTDGPTREQVGMLVGKFEGATFDGMTDYKDYVYREINGEEVHFCADFIFKNRSYSNAAYDGALRSVCTRGRIPLITMDDIEKSGMSEWFRPVPNLGDDLQRLTLKELHCTSFCPAKHSATLAAYFPAENGGAK